jgi:cysteine synthase
VAEAYATTRNLALREEIFVGIAAGVTVVRGSHWA